MLRFFFFFVLGLSASCSVTDRPTLGEAAESTVVTPAREEAPALTVPVPPSAAAPPASSVSAAPRGPCPTEMVHVGSFCVDRFEATLEEVRADGSRVPHAYYERPRAGAAYAAVSAPSVFPQAYISRNEAQAACEAANKRLCSRSEWLAACHGTATVVNPRPEDRPCNNGKEHLMMRLFGVRWGYRYEEEFNSPELDKTPGFLAKTGAYDRCVSDHGVHDMVGNVHEWVSDTVSTVFLASFVQETPRQYQPAFAGNGIFMGGFYSTTGEHGHGCLYTTVAHEPAYHDYSTGFRCCRAAE